jgi:hypothetical protein
LRGLAFMLLASIGLYVGSILIPILIMVPGTMLAIAYHSVGMVIASLIVGLVGLVVALVLTTAGVSYMYAVATVAVALHLRGQRADSQQIRRYLGRPVALRALGTLLLQMLAVAVGFVLLIIPGFIAMAWFTFSLPVVVIERTAYMRALRRSRELARGHELRILGALLCVSIIQLALQVIFQGLLGLVLSVQAAQTISSFAVIFIYAPLQFIFLVLLYFDIRVRKGEIGLEEIAEFA